MTAQNRTHDVNLAINGSQFAVKIEPRVSLLDTLRDHIGLTGTKKGCNQGACGACTVLIDGERVASCLTLAIQCEGKEVTTVEGLVSPDGELHALQKAFVKNDGFQCGYCTPGQLCSAIGMYKEFECGVPSAVSEHMTDKPKSTDCELRERMSGNICRCGAYNGIMEAIKETFFQGAE